MIQFPYGISDFQRIRSQGMLYLDRTAHIPAMEAAGDQLVFLRPRRFGKSLLLSMLANYYDLYAADEFPTLFGDLAIGKKPTAERNQYLILRWDFSKVSAQGDLAAITGNLFRHLNECIKGFAQKYQAILKFPITVYPEDALASFDSLANSVKNSGHTLYLLIDEYDNFANEILTSDPHDRVRYHDLLEGEGVLKTLFKVIKASATESKISRVFITGVSPVVLSDMTSGYNVATSIYLDEDFNSLCGIPEAELQGLVQQIMQGHGLAETHVAEVMETLRRFYNGYRFCKDLTQTTVYNPTLCFYALRHYQKKAQLPDQMLDGNLAMDAGRIRYIANLPAGAAVIDQILDETRTTPLRQLETRFGVEQLQRVQHDPAYMLSLLYFFGVLTIADVDGMGRLVLAIPNLVIRGLYVEQLKEQTLPRFEDQQTAQHLAENFYQTADLQPLVEFVENKYFAVFSNRDYRWSNELTVKTAFMTLLFNDLYYIMDSEAVIQRRYSDLLMIIRPNMRRFPLLKDIVLEFKYVSLADATLTAEQVRNQSRETLATLPAVQTAMQAALAQLRDYRQALEAKYQQPDRLHCLAVVALGFERVLWQAC
ncbi:AAA family ATPase [Thiothrix nivea]|uniref:AAA-ATPase-like protein n=1 Tax=Thiothrix nivea (strain ATCC 35100 / DSM 5205 / JP2) TaxID=870187 RepID=A0A656HFT6_THINJ|nr:AAA family ATPase [Thiothrix nivea]EIJ34864.1 AAA-ATPase-like protein [Thiothrix nivea DSM 5205]